VICALDCIGLGCEIEENEHMTRNREERCEYGEDLKDGTASSSCAWEGNSKIERKEVAWEVADKIHLARKRD